MDHAYRTRNAASARFLTGHSSDGWASLRLQITYPRLFGGTWSTSPDPVDFHAFINADRYAPGADVYRGQNGHPLALTRRGASIPAVDFQASAQLERVLGSYGGQNAAFEWVFSPRGEDRESGAVLFSSLVAHAPRYENAFSGTFSHSPTVIPPGDH